MSQDCPGAARENGSRRLFWRGSNVSKLPPHCVAKKAMTSTRRAGNCDLGRNGNWLRNKSWNAGAWGAHLITWESERGCVRAWGHQPQRRQRSGVLRTLQPLRSCVAAATGPAGRDTVALQESEMRSCLGHYALASCQIAGWKL